MTHVLRRIYGQMTYSDFKQADIFVENDAIVPIENSMYVIYHDPIKRSFRYDQKTKTFQQIDMQECELTARHLLCHDTIFHRIIDTTCNDIQRIPLTYVEEQMTMKKLQRKDKLEAISQNYDELVRRSSPNTEISQGQNFNEYKLLQGEYLKIKEQMRI